MILHLLFQISDPFTRRLMEESFSYEYTYDSSGVYGVYNYSGTKDTVRYYTLQEFFGINLINLLRKSTVKAYDTSSAEAISGLIPDIEVPVHFSRRWSFLGSGPSRITLRGEQTISIGGEKEDLLSPEGENLNNQYQISNAPGLDMKQTLNVTITGHITDRLKVEVKHNSEEIEAGRNRVLLSYTGTDDDIVQSLQAGDIDVSDFPNTSYASLGAGAGLFGLKGRFALGPARIFAVATKERGITQSKVFRAQSQLITDTIWGSEYVRNTFFLLPVLPFLPPGENPADYHVENLILFYKPLTFTGNTYVFGKAYHLMDTLGILTDDTARCFVSGRFVQMDPASYAFYTNNVVQILEQPQADYWWLGAIYKIVKNDGTDTIDVGYIPPSPDTSNPIKMLLMKLDERRSSDTSLTCAMQINMYELKNVYYLPYELDTSVNLTSVIFQIYKDNPTTVDSVAQDGIRFSTLLGVDPEGDERINEIVNINGTSFRVLDIRPDGGGYLIFPKFWPFADSVLSDPDSMIYLMDQEYWRQHHKEKYYMVFTFRKPQKFINLGGSVLKGSVEIFKNGQKLQEGKDYTVNYDFGTVTFLTPLNETDEIKINYRLLSIGAESRAILGLATAFDFSENFRMNVNYVSKSRASAYPRPDFEMEPTRYSVLDVAVKARHHPEYIDRFLNRYTPLDLERRSEISLNMEVAKSFPDPNTAGDAYIDDFDDARADVDNLVENTRYRSWIHGSLPYILDTATKMDTALLAKRQSWYSDIMAVKRDIMPVSDPAEESEPVRLMRLIAEPNVEGIPSFMSIMTGYRTPLNYADKEYVEIYVKGKGIIVFDFGTNIPEDAYIRACDGKFYGLGELNTEDLNQDNQFNELNEDVGLDGVAGRDTGCSPQGGDWGNDDYTISDPKKSDPFLINRYEGDHSFQTEDLNRNFQLDMLENFYSFVVDLDTTEPYYEYNGWKLYRIPLKKPTKVYGNPALDRVQYFRISWYGFRDNDTLFIATIGVGGGFWINEGLKVDPADSTQFFAIGFVSKKTTPGYEYPPGVEEKLTRDYTTNTLEDEGAMTFIYDIKPGDYALARKNLAKKYNFVNYNSISMWVWDRSGTSPEIIVRFGTDSLNFYEYRQRVEGGGWKPVKIRFDSLVEFKRKNPGVGYRSNGRYGVKGNPSIFEVQFFWIGVGNPSPGRISGELWVNELRLSDPVRTSAHAGNVSLVFNVSDLLSFTSSGNFEQIDFARSATDLSQFNSQNLNVNSTFNVHRLFPAGWGLNLPLNLSYSFGRRYPKFKPGLDIPVISEDERRSLSSVSRSTAYNISFSKTGSTNRLAKWFIDPWKLSHGMRTDYSNVPGQSRDSTTTENYGIRYSYRPTGDFMWRNRRYKYLPTSYSISYDYTRTASHSEILGSRSVSENKQGRLSYSFNYDPIPGMFSFGYSGSRTGDYRFPSLFRTKADSILGFESRFSENFTSSLNLGRLWIFNPSTNYRHGYTETRKPENALEGQDLRDLSENLNVSFNATVEHGRVLSGIGSLRDKSKDTSLSTAGALHTLLYGMEKLSQFWRSMRFSYSFGRTSNYYAALGRAYWKYRLGIDINPKVDVSDTLRSAWREDHNFDVSTDVSVGRYRLSPRWSRSISLSDNSSQRVLTVSTRFPDLTLSVSTVPLIENFNFVASSNLTLNYSDEVRTTTYPLWEPASPLDTVEPKTSMRTRTLSISPRLTLKNGTSVDMRHTRTTSENDQIFSATHIRTLSDQVNYEITVNHTFSSFAGFKLPWSQKRFLNLKNQLTLSLNYRISRGQDVTINYTLLDNMVDTLSRRKSDNLTLSATYKFSNAVTATFSYIYDLSGDYESGFFTRRSQIRADVVIKF